ncbi:MAG: hypothetical protein KA072_04560 [Thermoanaerobaculaceae bacterium]|nr:hypothetical protein [Thermoanaerobaculaceae bacterium]HPW54397.1 hypothetical protein [Thermoanaerobaculaceae bacterium]
MAPGRRSDEASPPIRSAANRSYFGDFDPFGDFDLIFGAARLSLAFVDIPIRYRERTYGTTNIQRWRRGWIPLRMLVFASRRLKFVRSSLDTPSARSLGCLPMHCAKPIRCLP